MNLADPTLLRQHCFIDGQWLPAADGAVTSIVNPANGVVLGTVPDMSVGEARGAIYAAARAQPGWAMRTAKERADLLRRWFDVILANQDELALLITAEQGKPLREAKGEIAFAASFIEWFAEEARRVYGEIIPPHAADKRLLVLRQPIGVVAAITPWNFPAAMITRKAAPALAAGCTFVCKPAAQTPFSALALAALAERAGIPPGVFNIVTGSPEAIGSELAANPLVRKLSFTGSTRVGKLLMAQCAGTLKKLSLELGGNAPFIIFDDADLDAAVLGAMEGKYRNAGQTCVCPNRFLVQDGIYEEFAARLTRAAKQLRVGDGTEASVDQGPLIDAKAVQKVEDQIHDALAKGARLICGGKRHARGGTFFEPTVLADVTPQMRIAREETFGPVSPLFRFTTEAQAVQMANATEFGLASYLYTRDIARAWRVSEALEYGMVGLNTGLISTAVAPFGGIKESGIGREGSRHGILEYTELKYLCIGGIAPP